MRVVLLVCLSACANPVVVDVTARGLIRIDGENTNLRHVIARARSSRRAEPWTVRAEPDALWMHVQWVLAGLGEAGHERARCRVGNRTARLRIHSGAWMDRLYHLESEPLVARMLMARGAATMSVLAAKCRAFACDQEWEAGLEPLHPWDRGRSTLPPPPHDEEIFRWFVTDRQLPRLQAVNLPVANVALEDKNNDKGDRIIVDLTAAGRLFVDGDEHTLAGLSERFREAVRHDGRSALFVLVRADETATWRQVRWILAELRRHRLYKLQFGARRQPGDEFTPEETARRQAAWELTYPPVCLEAKLACFVARPDLREGDERVGPIRCEPETPLGEVVGRLNTMTRAEVTVFDYGELEPAPKAVRETSPLPR